MHTFQMNDDQTFTVLFVTHGGSIEIAKRDQESDAMALVNYLNGGSGKWPDYWRKVVQDPD